MEFRILGPLEVVDEGRPVAIHRGKERALLAYLLLHPNELVPADRLIDELWGERPPPTAPKILQNAVSQLRKGLGDGRLMTQPPGYRFRLESGELDLHRFERLAEAGRAQGDPTLLREALATWRGEPLADLRDELFAQRAALQLEEARLAVLEDRIDADLAAGRDAELVPELEQLIVRHPLRERPYGQLMLALYRSGRQADALDAYRRARKTLNQELGLEPSPQLRDLERKILKQDPELATPSRADRELGPPPPPRRWLALLALVIVGAAAITAFALTRADEHTLTVVPNSLVKIDPKTNRIVDVVRVGRRPAAVATVGRNLWVANSLDDTLTRVDTRTGETRTLGGFPYPSSLTKEGQRVWVGNNSSGVLVAIDGVNGTVVERLRLKGAAAASFVAYGANSIWVSEEEMAVLRVSLTTRGITNRLPEATAHGLAFGNGAAWVVLGGLSQILRIDANDETRKAIPVGSLPSGVAVGFGAVWVASANDDTVWRVNAAIGRVDDVVHVGDRPDGVAVAAGSVWVANHHAGTVSRIDPRTNRVVATVRTGYFPLGIAGGADGVWITISGTRDT
jgi:YVTN family beta-propeller protein